MVSEPTTSNVHPATPPDCRIWRRAFERKLREQPRLQRSFCKLIDDGCDQNELESSLFHAVVSHIAKAEWKRGQTQKRIKDFFDLLDKTIPKIAELQTALDALLIAPSSKRRVLDAYASFLHHMFPSLKIWQQRNEVRLLPAMLYELDLLLGIIRGLKGNLPPGFWAEVLLFEYIGKTTRRRVPHFATISPLLELACEAYEMGLGKYQQEAVTKRYRRFKEADKKKLGKILRDYFAQGDAVNLIPFATNSLVSAARSKINARPVSKAHKKVEKIALSLARSFPDL